MVRRDSMQSRISQQKIITPTMAHRGANELSNLSHMYISQYNPRVSFEKMRICKEIFASIIVIKIVKMMLDDSLKRHELFSRLVGNFYDNFPGFFR
jgi:hypothetical protein